MHRPVPEAHNKQANIQEGSSWGQASNCELLVKITSQNPKWVQVQETQANRELHSQGGDSVVGAVIGSAQRKKQRKHKRSLMMPVGGEGAFQSRSKDLSNLAGAPLVFSPGGVSDPCSLWGWPVRPRTVRRDWLGELSKSREQQPVTKEHKSSEGSRHMLIQDSDTAGGPSRDKLLNTMQDTQLHDHWHVKVTSTFCKLKTHLCLPLSAPLGQAPPTSPISGPSPSAPALCSCGPSAADPVSFLFLCLVKLFSAWPHWYQAPCFILFFPCWDISEPPNFFTSHVCILCTTASITFRKSRWHHITPWDNTHRAALRLKNPVSSGQFPASPLSHLCLHKPTAAQWLHVCWALRPRRLPPLGVPPPCPLFHKYFLSSCPEPGWGWTLSLQPNKQAELSPGPLDSLNYIWEIYIWKDGDRLYILESRLEFFP